MTEPITTGRLTSTGWTGWAEVLQVLGDDECLWIDLNGPHHGAVPTQRPAGATHLWSWRPQRWTRVRIDGDRVLTTVLTTTADAPGDAVTFRTSAGLPWKDNPRAARWEHPVTLVVTEGTAPITFVEVHPTTASTAA